jgi:phospholipid/cholesterol/gamma-HCH transport system substrate-binding protein
MSDSLPYFRYASRRVGALVLIAFAIFVVAVLQAGLLRDLFRSTLSLRVILPESGLAGLNKGAAVEILGTNAGVVREIVIDPKENFHAVVEIEEAMEPFVRRDSQVFIRKQFGIAGAAFLEITRGHGEPLDWDYAVLTAAADQAPTESMGAILEDLRAKVLPIVDDVQRTIGAAGDLITQLQAPGGQLQTILTDLGKVTGRLAAGEGTVGRLLADDALARDLGATLVSVRRQVGELDSVIADLKSTSGEVERATPEITKLLRETSGASVALPTLLTQTQQTMAELQQLLVQLQGVWLLGGRGDGDATERTRLSPLKARP